MIAFTKTAAVEVARRGVTINAVAPGLIATDMTGDVPDAMRERVPAQRAGHARGGRRRRSLPRLGRAPATSPPAPCTSTAASPPDLNERNPMAEPRRADREGHHGVADHLRRRRRPDQPRGRARGARHRLARPRRALADHRGAVRRRADERRRRGDPHRRRRGRPRRGARLTRDDRRRRHRGRRGHAARASARARCTSAGPPASVRDRGRRGPLPRLRRRPTTSRSRRRGAPTASRSSRSSPRSRRSPTPAGTAGCPTTRRGSARSSAPGIGGIGTIEANDHAAARARPQAGLAARGAADDGQRRRGGREHAPRPARAGFGTISACAAGADAIGTAMRAIVAATPSRSSPAAPRRR